MSVIAKVDSKTIDYTNYAPDYDGRRFHGRTNHYLERIRMSGLTRAVAGLSRNARVVDVGCGTGRGMCDLRHLGFQSVIGVDYTYAMLQQAARKLEVAGRRAPSLVRGDGFRLPFDDASFPIVVSFNFLHMFRFDLQQELVAELLRVCEPGGTVIAEMESVHKGLVVSRYVEQRRVRTRTKFTSVFEAQRLFPTGLVEKRKAVGTVLPLAYRALQYAPSLGETVESITHVPPFNWLASRVFVIARRRAEMPLPRVKG